MHQCGKLLEERERRRELPQSVVSVQDCTDVRQFMVGSPQMIELNTFFDKVSSRMLLLSVA